MSFLNTRLGLDFHYDINPNIQSIQAITAFLKKNTEIGANIRVILTARAIHLENFHQK